MSHERAGESNEWYTPDYIFEAMSINFDTDVASPKDRSHCNVPSEHFITEDSLSLDWNGVVWMNPPFGNQKNKFLWIDKFIEHGNGVALMPDRSSAPWWQYFAKNSDAVLFVDGKIKFIKPDGTKGESPANGTTLFAIGQSGVQGLVSASKNGLGILFNK